MPTQLLLQKFYQYENKRGKAVVKHIEIKKQKVNIRVAIKPDRNIKYLYE